MIINGFMSGVIIYTTPDCQFCKLAKAYLNGNSVEYEEKDVSDDPQAKAEMMTKSGQSSVPVLDIKGRILVGFNVSSLNQILEINKISNLSN